MIGKTLLMAMLFDIYGELLTEKQKRFFELYHHRDLSLGEIAEGQGISRQAVYDILKRSEKALRDFEDRLHLLQRDDEIRQTIAKMAAAAEQLQELTVELPPETRQRAAAAINLISEGLAQIGV